MRGPSTNRARRFTFVEPSPELFVSASGYAGRFAAKDWFSPASVALGPLSFEEHCKHALEKEERGWFLVPDPLRLCQHLLRKCLDAEVCLHHLARAISAQTDVRDELAGVSIAVARSRTERDVPCGWILVAAAAWSPQVFAALFPAAPLVLPITSIAGHSLVALDRERPSARRLPRRLPLQRPGYSPEIFFRAAGNIYIADLNSAAEPLSPLAAELGAHEDGDDDHAGGRIDVLREGLCFRPADLRPHPRPLPGASARVWALGRS
ncbi:hypothetical protein DL766_003071 [Monosporascus sp. MC13-8B]|uniref:FAD dependent oxidoreductase domain-containing protein n=1 Tax=Monosporascus cannonballus TaxID=155416 RepID=A0ABY0HCJ5_9PEZI|nr:hypothetical protein DL762_003778 [Monosporascus cannonballus]RYO96294.1 hypothetical protein DL763_003267 [Monosporascus cannonballus]RYP34296.1 hypothetical protein DL766_003071 [Monosporascus sp. MC13-8B]